MSLVSIIVPVYNCEHFLNKCLSSLINQTYSNIEILIADDGSHDNSKNIIDNFAKKDKRIKCYHNNINLGNVRTRNKLFSLAKGDYITVQDADDWSSLTRIEKQLKIIEKKNVSAVVTNYYRVSKTKKNNKNKNKDSYVNLEKYHSWSFCMASIFIKKEVFKDIGNIPLILERIIAEDKYWISKIVERYKTYEIAEPLYYYRANPTSLTNNIYSKKKLVATCLISELIQQRINKKYDWVEKNDKESIDKFIENKLSDKIFIGNKYREMSAVKTDLKQYKIAIIYISYAITLSGINKVNLKTLLYLIRSLISELYIFL